MTNPEREPPDERVIEAALGTRLPDHWKLSEAYTIRVSPPSGRGIDVLFSSQPVACRGDFPESLETQVDNGLLTSCTGCNRTFLWNRKKHHWFAT